MKHILFFLFIPLTTFAGAEHCASLGKTIEEYEKDLARAAVQDCSNINVDELLSGIPVTDKSFVQDRKCRTLSSIESEIQNLKTELSIVEGIKKLTTEVSASMVTSGDQNPRVARVAGMSFVASLNTAQSLEVMLNTTLTNGRPLLEEIKSSGTDKLLTENDLINKVKVLCKDMGQSENNACNPKIFKPRPEAFREILQLMKTGEPNADQVKRWKGMLSIERENPGSENASYSFTEMQIELENAFSALDRKQIMSKEHLRAIKKLDTFKTASGFSFVEDLANIPKDKQQEIKSNQFFLLMGDAQRRQQFEVMSRLSVAWENHKGQFTGLGADQIRNCTNAKENYEEAKFCLKHLRDGRSAISDSSFKDQLLPSIEASASYADKLQTVQLKCKQDIEKTGALPASCLNEMNKDAAEIQKKLLHLNRIKDRIGSQNQDMMKYRNFALQQWAQHCDKIGSQMDLCDLTGPEALSKEAFLTVTSSMQISVLFTPEADAEEKVKELCDDETKKKRKNHEEKLCALLNKTPVVIETRNQPTTDPDGPVNAPDGGHADAVRRDRYIEATKNLFTEGLRTYLGSVYNTPQNFVNPYPYNYTPYNYGAPPMGIADSIMFNARYYGGYGFYMPTPGYQPYTAFGVNSSLSAYKPLSFSGTKYFTR
jgi:hypothetical protein